MTSAEAGLPGRAKTYFVVPSGRGTVAKVVAVRRLRGQGHVSIHSVARLTLSRLHSHATKVYGPA